MNQTANGNRKPKLETLAKWFHCITEETDNEIIIIDLDGTIQFLNTTYPPFNKEDGIGTSFFDRLDSAQSDMMRKGFQRIIETGKFLMSKSVPLYPDDENKYFVTKIAPIFEGEKVTGFAMISKNITRLKIEEETSETLQEQLFQVQKMEVMGHLTAGIAHDFNNILSNIMINADLIERSLAKDEVPLDEVKDMVKRLLNAAIRGTPLIKKMLSRSREEKYDPSIIDLNAILDDVTLICKKGFPPRKIDRKLKAEGQIYADGTHFFQVVQNLIVNAVHATEEADTIIVSSRDLVLDEPLNGVFGEIPVGEYVEVAVTDTGCGMDKETVRNIFDPFFTTKERGKGTGLGLYTVYGIVEKDGGHIRLETEVGKGTTFFIYFPAKGESNDKSSNRDSQCNRG